MISKMPLFVFVFVSFQLVFSYGDVAIDNSLREICAAPGSGGKGAERIHFFDASKQTDAFLSKNVKHLPVFCTSNSIDYRFEVEEPSADDKVMNAARAAIGETSPKAVEDAKTKLVNLLKKDTKLNVPLDNDEWLIRFLRFKKYDVPATYEMIKNYYNYKVLNKNLFDGLLPSKQLKIAETNLWMVLPKRDQNGRRNVIVSAKNWDPKKNTLVELLKTGIVLTELGAYETPTQIAGVQIIVDMSGLTMNHVKQLTPTMAKKIFDYVLRAAPFRYEAVHIVKQNRAFTALFNIMKPFMTKELRSKMFFHGDDMKSLHRRVSPSVLPEAYGGSAPTPGFSRAEWNTLLKSFDDEFTKISTYGVKKEN